MSYTDFEPLDPATTIPAASGQLSPAMILALVALIASLAGAVWMWKKISSVDADKKSERRSLRFGIAAALLGAVGAAGIFALTSITPDHRAVSTSEEEVRQNYDQLLDTYGFEAKVDMAQARIGDVIEVKRPSWDNYMLAKIVVVDEEVVLANTEGDPLPRD